jgi:uncharacterized RDD family membrane protein YckC
MQETVRIASPDQIDLEFDLAGSGSRFAAYLIDMVFMVVLVLGLVLLIITFIGVTTLVAFNPAAHVGEVVSSWAMAIIVIMVFLIQWGYFVFSESLMRGQTPGKKALGIRVLRDNGLPITFRQAVLRNLVRAADMLPPPSYLLAGIVSHFDRHGRRLGDMVAGTIVVREQFAFDVMPSTQHDWGATWMTRLEHGHSGPVVLPHGTVDAEHVGLIEQFMQRRQALPWDRRRELAGQILNPLLPLLDASWRPETTDPEALLGQMLQQARDTVKASARRPERGADEQTKQDQWQAFQHQAQRLLNGRRRLLRTISAEALRDFMTAYRRVTTDLARGRSLGADTPTLVRLNRLVVMGHNVLYGYVSASSRIQPGHWLNVVPRLVRAYR